MRILFVENRYKTYFWEAIAKELINLGHEISWIVQNHSFVPKCGTVYKVAYPDKKDLIINHAPELNSVFDFIKSTDRLINYFGKSDDHYAYYYREFLQILNQYQPDIVFGESTLFHELMVIDICKKKDIVYLNPSSSSYPSMRFSFYLNDTKEVFCGSQDPVEDQECDLLIDDIGNRKVVPDYMKKVQVRHRTYSKAGSLKNRWDILSSYYKGEKYNTPSPVSKVFRDRNVNHLLHRWDAVAELDIALLKDKKVVLYPLQMQPEANLDVWGNSFRDQAQLVKRLAENLPDGWHLIVKTNPKSKYEMNQALLDVVSEASNIIPLNSSANMKEVFDASAIVITVTGTVAIECVLTGKSLGLLGPSIVSDFKGVCKMRTLGEIGKLVERVENLEYKASNREDRRGLIKKLVSSSYKGMISDPVSNPQCLDKKNLNLVISAMTDVLGRIE
jgi:hypothetical protein